MGQTSKVAKANIVCSCHLYDEVPYVEMKIMHFFSLFLARFLVLCKHSVAEACQQLQVLSPFCGFYTSVYSVKE